MSWSSECSQDGGQEGFRRKMMVEDGGCIMHKDLERRASMLRTRANSPQPTIFQSSSKGTARKGHDPTSEGCGERRTRISCPQNSAL